MELLIVRHGECALDLENPRDPPLTDRGWKQARHTGQRLAAEPVDVLYCGPLLRNLQTTQCIHEATGMRPQLIWKLFELGCNQVARHGWRIREQFPFVGWDDPGTEWQREDQEDLEEAFTRARMLLGWLRRQYEATDTRVAMVSHGTFNELFLAACFGLKACNGARFSSGNCSFHWLELRPGWTKARKLNDESHIPEADRT